MKLYQFLNEVLPDDIPLTEGSENIRTKEDFIKDVVLGIKTAPMSIRLTPHILSVIDWKNPIDDPLRRQFIPMKSMQLADHPKLTLDSLHEADDSPVQGLVHRYVDKVLLLGSEFPSQFPNPLTIPSNLSLRAILPILHPLLCCRWQYRNCYQNTQQAHQGPLGRCARLHPIQPYHFRRRSIRWGFILSHSRATTVHRRRPAGHPSHPTLPHRDEGTLLLAEPHPGYSGYVDRRIDKIGGTGKRERRAGCATYAFQSCPGDDMGHERISSEAVPGRCRG
jgi:hypothetical protein